MSAESSTPRSIGPYEVEQLLGRGGMAEVYRVRRKGPGNFEKVLALKRILPRHVRSPSFVARFLEEARLSARLDHSNLVQVVDFGRTDGELYLVMEWVDGTTLFRLLAGGRFAPEVAAYVVAEAASGLARAHELTDEHGVSLGLVHRDVAPHNILVSRTGEVKVGDFGIAKVIGSSIRTTAGVVMGRLNYMSPEHARNEPLDGRADVYSLGIVLWECLTGRPLFERPVDEASLQAILHPKVQPPSAVTPVPAELDQIAMRALAPDREERTRSAAELARELRVWVHKVAPGFGPSDLAAVVGPAIPATPEDPIPPEERATRREGLGTIPMTPVDEVPATPGTRREKLAGPGVEVMGPPTAPPSTDSPARPVAAEPRPPRKRWTVAAVLVAIAVALGLAGQSLGLFGAAPTRQPSAGRPRVLVETVPAGARVITEEGILGRTPLQILEPKRLAVIRPDYAPVIVPFPARTLAAGPIRLVRAKGDATILEIDCGIEGRVIYRDRDVGPAPVFLAVPLVRGAPEGVVQIRAAGRPLLPVDVHIASGRPWSLVRIGPDNGCPRG